MKQRQNTIPANEAGKSEEVNRTVKEILAERKLLIRIGAGVMVFGCVLIAAALVIPPPGVIDNSVLLAFGEISTFAATIMGFAARKATKT